MRRYRSLDRFIEIYCGLEQHILAYAYPDFDLRRPYAAQWYAESFVSSGMQNTVAFYAHAEIRIRMLEILSISSNISTDAQWNRLQTKRLKELHHAEDAWLRLAGGLHSPSESPVF